MLENLTKTIQINQSKTDQRLNENQARTDQMFTETANTIKINQSKTDQMLNENQAKTDQMLNENQARTDQMLNATKTIQENQNKLEKTLAENTQKTEKVLQENFERFEKSMQEQESRVNQMFESFRVEQGERIETMQEQNEIFESEVRDRINNFEINIDDRIKTRCVNEVNEVILPIRQDINEIRDTLTQTQTRRHTENIQVTINPNLFKTDQSREKYYGEFKTNPKIFARELKIEVEGMGPELDLKKYLRGRFGGDAALWYNIVADEFETWEQFERMFLKNFWGTVIQGKIKENLYHGKYSDKFGNGRERYAMRKYAIARELEPAMEEKDIISYLARHFEDEVCDVIAIHEIDTIEKLLNYLKRLDSSMEGRYRRNQGNPQERRDGWRFPFNNEGRREDRPMRENNSDAQGQRKYEQNYRNYNQRRNNDNYYERKNYDNRYGRRYNEGNDYRRNGNQEYRTNPENDKRREYNAQNNNVKYNSAINIMNQRRNERDDGRQRRNLSDPGRTRGSEQEDKINRESGGINRDQSPQDAHRQVTFKENAMIHRDSGIDQDFQ